MKTSQFAFISFFVCISFVVTKSNLKLLKQNAEVETTTITSDTVVASDVETIQSGDYSVHALGKSGKILINKGTSEDRDFKQVSINLSALREISTTGVAITGTGSNKHSFENFAQLSFTFSSIVDAEKDGLKVKTFVIQAANIVGTSVLKVRVYIFLEDGEIEIGNLEKQQVYNGDVKFNVEVENWPFCKSATTCSGITCCKSGNVNLVGQFLDLEIEMRSNDKTTPTTQGSDEGDRVDILRFSNDNVIFLNNNIYVDDAWRKMATHYPKQKSTEAKNTFVFRLPVFSKKVSYDPVVRLSSGFTKTCTLVLLALAFFLF